MERTISRIKNLKTRRKLSLPASPSPSYSASSIGGAGGGQPSADGDTATSPCPPLATSPTSVTGGGRTRRGGAGGPTAARSGSLCVPAPNKRSLESTPKEWSPPLHGQHPPPTRVRQPRRASVCGVGGGGGVVQHLIRYPMITTASPPASSPAAPAGAAGRYTRRSDSVSTVEEEEDEMAAVRARVLAGNGQRKTSRAGEMKTEWRPRFESCNTEISKKAWLFAKLQPERARKRIKAT